MKTKMTLTLLAAFGALALTAKAQDGGGPPDGGPPGGDGQGGGPGQGRHHPPIPAIVRALDVNHDGIIDSNEIANASAELKTLDKNGDGQLTRDEYIGMRPGRPPGDGGPGGGDSNGTNKDSDGPQGPPPGGDQNGGPGGFGGPGGGGHRHPPIPAIVRALDVNHDGIIDSNEIANASAELKTLDKNGDGQLTRNEYMGPRPNRPPRDFNGGGNDDNNNGGGPNGGGGMDGDDNGPGGPPDGAPDGPPPGN